VCGSDGVTYSNNCLLEAASCYAVEAGGVAITKQSDGDCSGVFVG
jgi:hypothetical protein